MTVVSKNIKTKAKTDYNFILKLVIFGFMGFSSVKSLWCDIPFAFVGLSFLSALKEKEIKAGFISGYFVQSAIMSFSDRFYIPYFIAVIIYTAVYRALDNEKISLISTSTALVFIKIFTLSYSWQYKVYSVIEGILIYCLAFLLKTGLEEFEKEMNSYTDFTLSLLTLFTLGIMFSGFDGFMVYFSVAVAMGISWFFINNGKIELSVLSLLAALICGVDKKEFALIFMGMFSLWCIGAYFCEKSSAYFYIFTTLAAIFLNLAMIYRFTGFAFATTMIFSLIIYFFLSFMPCRKVKSEIFTDNKDWRQLVDRMNKLQKSLNFLADCAIDISKLNEKNLSCGEVESLVAEQVCRKCKHNMNCWRENYSFTYDEFSNYKKKKDFSPSFYKQCDKAEKLKQSFEYNSDLLLSKKYILQSQKNSQELLQEAFLSISATVGDMVYKNRNTQLVNSSLTMTMDKFLTETDIRHTYCICSQNPDKMNFSTLEPLTETDLYKVKSKLEKVCDSAFDDGNFEKRNNEFLYTFLAVPMYDFDISVKTQAKNIRNGDNSIYFVTEGRLFVILSDGMGTGAPACAESNTVIAMTESMIKAGVNLSNVVNIVNLALNLKSGSELSSTLDILSVNLYDGKAVIVKAGAAETVVISDKTYDRYYQDSLPLGILRNIKPSTFEFTLSEKDTVLLASDGIGRIDCDIKDKTSCEALAENVFNQNYIQDDKTVIAVRLMLR